MPKGAPGIVADRGRGAFDRFPSLAHTNRVTTASPGIYKASQPMFGRIWFFHAELTQTPPRPRLYTFVYCSRAAVSVDDRRSQPPHRVGATPQSRLRPSPGCSFFGSGVFFQWIEGPAAAVRKADGKPAWRSAPLRYRLAGPERGKARASVSEIGRWSGSVPTTSAKCFRDALESAEDENNVRSTETYSRSFGYEVAGFAWAS